MASPNGRGPVTVGSEDLPPGTVLLVRDSDLTGSTPLLVPTPSSDPNDPLNWSPLRKTVNFTIVFAVSVAVFTTLSVQTVYWQQMNLDLHISFEHLNNAQSANLAGLAVGCIFFIPLARKFGRRPTYILSTAIMAAVAWWCARMQSLTELYLTNLFHGLAGATNEALVQMTIADLFFVHQRGTLNALYLTAVMIGSFLTPMAAGVQAQNEGWRWSYYTLAIFLTVLFVVCCFAYEETKYVVPDASGASDHDAAAAAAAAAGPQKSDAQEERHDGEDAKSQRLEPHTSPASDHQRRPPPLKTYRQRLRLITKTPEPFWKLLYFPVYVAFLPHVFFTSLQYAAGVAWLVISSATIAMVLPFPPYNFGPAAIGYMGVAPFIGNLVGSFYGGVLSDWAITRLARRNKGYFEPEMRLYHLLPPALFMAGGLIMQGATFQREMHWIYPAVGGAFFAYGLGAIGDTSFTLVIDTYRPITGEAFVTVAFFRNAVSVGVPFGITRWMRNMGLQNMFLVAGFVSLFISLLFVPLILWGKRIRTALAPQYAWILREQAKLTAP